MSEQGFSGTKAATIVGITYRQLDYWARTDLIRPSLADASGSGSRRLYSYRDLLELRVIKSLLDAGIKLESVRTAFEYLRTHLDDRHRQRPPGHQRQRRDPVRRRAADRRHATRGQGVLNVLAIGGVKDDLDSTIVELDGGVDRRAVEPSRHVMSDVQTQSPLDAVHRGLGAKMVPFGGWEMPLSYPPGTLDEHLACRNDAVVFDVCHLGTVRVEGADAFERLQLAFTNDLHKIAPGPRAVHASARRGRRIGARRHHRVVGRRRGLRRHAERVATPIVSRAAIGGDETTHDRAVLAVQGPRAKERLATVFPDAAAVGRFRVSGSTGRASTAWWPAPATRAKQASRSPCPMPPPPTCGTAVTGAGVTPAGLGRRDTLRLEAGLPLHGHEFGPGITSLQAGLGWVVAWSKRIFAVESHSPPSAQQVLGAC